MKTHCVILGTCIDGDLSTEKATIFRVSFFQCWFVCFLCIVVVFAIPNLLFSDPSEFENIIKTVKQYNNDGGNEISIGEILPIVRQFCSEPDIQTSIKSSVLHLVEELFKLTGEDVELLMYFQSNSIIQGRWDVQVWFM